MALRRSSHRNSGSSLPTNAPPLMSLTVTPQEPQAPQSNASAAVFGSSSTQPLPSFSSPTVKQIVGATSSSNTATFMSNLFAQPAFTLTVTPNLNAQPPTAAEISSEAPTKTDVLISTNASLSGQPIAGTAASGRQLTN